MLFVLKVGPLVVQMPEDMSGNGSSFVLPNHPAFILFRKDFIVINVVVNNHAHVVSFRIPRIMKSNQFSLATPDWASRSTVQSVTAMNKQSHLISQINIAFIPVEVCLNKSLCCIKRFHEFIRTIKQANLDTLYGHKLLEFQLFWRVQGYLWNILVLIENDFSKGDICFFKNIFFGSLDDSVRAQAACKASDLKYSVSLLIDEDMSAGDDGRSIQNDSVSFGQAHQVDAVSIDATG